MTFILDTNVISVFRRKRVHPTVARWMARTGSDEIATTVVTITEIQRGIERARVSHPDVANETSVWLDGMLAAGEPQVLPLNVDAARLLGRLYEQPALRHFMITDPNAKEQATGADLAIAAIAVSTGAVIATGNIVHFLQIHGEFPLPGLFNPFTPAWHVPPVAFDEPA